MRLARRIQPPLAGYTLQHMRAAILEVEARAGHQILDGAGDQCFIGAGQRRDTRGDVDRDAGDIIAMKLDLSGVQPGANCYAELAREVLYA